jgi:hypothetical protein
MGNIFMPRILLRTVFLFLASCAVSSLRGADDLLLPAPPTDTAEEAAKTKIRFEFMTGALKHFQVSVPGKGSDHLVETPLLRWFNPQGNVLDGILVAYTRGGRPDVLAQLAIHSEKNVVHEFQATSTQQVEMRRNDQLMWHPDGPLELKTLDAMSEPARNETLRLAQMRSIAEKFQVFDDFGWNEKVRQQLRLLRQPIYRYTDESEGIIDGAIFTFVLATDPEANLFVEAYRDGETSKWRYAFRPMTIYKLEAFLNDQMVWNCPETKKFGNATCHHYSYPYRPDPSDVSIIGQMPKSPMAVKN